MRVRFSKLLLLPLLLLQTASIWASDDFPHRSEFPNIKIIEIEELYNRRNEVIIYDVRSAYEYNTLHIKEARHLALDDANFVANLKELRATDSRPLVFYCNGYTCKKSYAATRKALSGDIDNIYAFDAGVHDWAKAYPGETVLLGNNPIDPRQLISKDKLEAHMLEPGEFALRVGKNAITLDVRDPTERSGITLFPTRQRYAALNGNKLERFLTKAKRDKKTLLIYDNVGQQVRSLQYYLELSGLTNYYFMKGGVKGFLKPRGPRKSS